MYIVDSTSNHVFDVFNVLDISRTHPCIQCCLFFVHLQHSSSSPSDTDVIFPLHIHGNVLDRTIMHVIFSLVMMPQPRSQLLDLSNVTWPGKGISTLFQFGSTDCSGTMCYEGTYVRWVIGRSGCTLKAQMVKGTVSLISQKAYSDLKMYMLFPWII